MADLAVLQLWRGPDNMQPPAAEVFRLDLTGHRHWRCHGSKGLTLKGVVSKSPLWDGQVAVDRLLSLMDVKEPHACRKGRSDPSSVGWIGGFPCGRPCRKHVLTECHMT